MGATIPGVEADTGTSEVRSEGKDSKDGSSPATSPTAGAHDGQAIISIPEEVPSQTVEDHAELSSTVDPVDISPQCVEADGYKVRQPRAIPNSTGP